MIWKILETSEYDWRESIYSLKMNDGKKALRRAQNWKLENGHWFVSDGNTVFKGHEHSSTATLRENDLDIICDKNQWKIKGRGILHTSCLMIIT